MTGPAAAAPALTLPLDCRFGIDCFVQAHVDVDPGPMARDFTCGPLSYDQHRGTDFRLLDRAAMARGVAVLAPADGTVTSVRDGMPDDAVGFDDSIRGRECGNGIRLDHGDGWETQLCHMRRGSIRVAVGDRVIAGQPVGQVGLSGATEFPHVHLAVRHDGEVVDPYSGRAGDGLACGVDDARPLWAPALAPLMTYRPSGLLGAGFAPKAPTKAELADGLFQEPSLSADAPALVFWGRIFGLRKGDVEAVRLAGPDGAVLAEASATATRDRALAFRFAGKRLRGPRWPAGTYVGSYTVRRDGAAVIHVEKTLVMP